MCESVFKVLVIGDSSVGKTAMVARYCHNRWLAQYKVTLGGNACMQEAAANADLYLWPIKYCLREVSPAVVWWVCDLIPFQLTMRSRRSLGRTEKLSDCMYVANQASPALLTPSLLLPLSPDVGPGRTGPFQTDVSHLFPRGLGMCGDVRRH